MILPIAGIETLRDKLLNPWAIFGFAAQFAFFMRFVIQWIASEKKGRSHVPVVFWYFSLAGGSMLFVYASVYLRDPVFTLGQGLGCFIYIRNLILIHRRSARVRDRRRGALDSLMHDGLENSVGDDGAPAGTSNAQATDPPSSSPSAPRQLAPTSSL